MTAEGTVGAPTCLLCCIVKLFKYQIFFDHPNADMHATFIATINSRRDKNNSWVKAYKSNDNSASFTSLKLVIVKLFTYQIYIYSFSSLEKAEN
jgi:hypothetical protein